jgi:hypothetical protein
MAATTLWSCQKDLDQTFVDNINQIPNLTTKINSSVSGFVVDENNEAVAGASVVVYDKTTTTDDYGYFSVKNVNVVKTAAVVTVNKSGYFPGIKTYIATENKSAFFRIKLIPKLNSGSFNSLNGGTISLSNGMIYSKTFSSSETNKLSIHTPILTTVSSGAEWILSFIGNQSLAKVKFGKVIVYPRAKSLEDKDPMDIKTENNVGKIAVAVSEKMLLLEAMQEFFLPYYPNFLLEASKIESIPNYTKWISDLNVQSKPTKFSTTEIGIFNSIALLDKKLIGELYTINQELQSEIKDPKKMEDLEAKRSLLENQLLKGATPDETNKISVSPIFKKPKYAISRSISRRLSYYKRKGLYKRQSKRVLTSESEIYDYYERLEKLLLTNDRIEIGTIISQDSSLIILHTEDGIKRIPAEEVLEVTYDYYKPRP